VDEGETFFDLISLVLALDLSASPPDEPDLATFNRRIELELEKIAAQNLRNQGLATETAAATLPYLAWIDERILTSSRPDRGQWAESPLIRRYQGASHGGDLFYMELARLLTRRHDHITGHAEAPNWRESPLPEGVADRLGYAQKFEKARATDKETAQKAWPDDVLVAAFKNLGLPANRLDDRPAGLQPTLDSLNPPAGPKKNFWASQALTDEASSAILIPYPRPEGFGEGVAPDSPEALGLGPQRQTASLKFLARLWSLSGVAPPNLEATIEGYALTLLLGFRGRLADPAQAEAERAIVAAAAAFLTAQRPPPSVPVVGPLAGAVKAAPQTFWERHRVAITHGLLPVLVALAVFLKGAAVVESLPF
jgi:type VI protein secretion system component VasF